MTKASDNEFPSILLGELSVKPTTPAAGKWRLYAKSGGLYLVDDAGTEIGPFGTNTATGDVLGPASAVDGNMAKFDTTTGKLLKDGGIVTSGVYTPSLTNATNVAASTANECQWMRIGNVVTVSGAVNIDPTATGAVILGISLPVASNFANSNELAGVGADSVGDWPARISADTANDRASLVYMAISTISNPWWFTFTYQIK